MKARYPRVSTVGNDNNSQRSDFWLFNGAYLRVKNITLGYTIPKEISQKFLVNNLRVGGKQLLDHEIIYLWSICSILTTHDHEKIYC